MAIFSTDHGANDRVFIGQDGKARKVLANLDARHVRGYGPKFAAHFARGIGLQIKHVLVRRSARQENHDDRLVRAADAGLRFGLEKLWQGQAAETECADFEKISARDTVAEPLFRSVDCQHKRSFNL